jgi:FtsH-binding integral membrane protein
MRHVYSTKRETRSAGDVIFWLIIGIDIVLLIGWAIKFFTG